MTIGIVNKAELDVFWNSLAFSDPMDVGNWIYGSSAFSKTSLNIWKFMLQNDRILKGEVPGLVGA